MRASVAKDSRLALSGTGGVSLFPLFLLRPNNDRPALDCRPDLSFEDHMSEVVSWTMSDKLTDLTSDYHATLLLSALTPQTHPSLLLLPSSKTQSRVQDAAQTKPSSPTRAPPDEVR